MMKYEFDKIAVNKDFNLAKAIQDFEIFREATFPMHDDCYKVEFIVNNREAAEELLARTGMSEEDYQGDNKEWYFFLHFSTNPNLFENSGISCEVVNGDEALQAIADLSDEEKSSLYEKVIREVPEAKPFVDYHYDMVKERNPRMKSQGMER